MQYSINVVSQLTGLSAHTIRAWENRYGVVKPQRSEGRHRLYSEEEVERLRLLREATEAGHTISRIADLTMAELRRISGRAARPHRAGAVATRISTGSGEFIRESVEAIQSLNAAGFDGVLQRAVLRLGHQGLLKHVVAPLVQEVGQLWKDGTITAAHEHFATALLRSFLMSSARPFAGNGGGAHLVVATPAGQIHELGAVLAAAAAVNDGWQVTYLGASLPAAEIAGAALQNRARAVALSVVYPEDDPNLPEEFERIRRYLSKETAILVGGRAAPAYGQVLDKIGAMRSGSLEDLYSQLAALRRPQNPRGKGPRS